MSRIAESPNPSIPNAGPKCSLISSCISFPPLPCPRAILSTVCSILIVRSAAPLGTYHACPHRTFRTACGTEQGAFKGYLYASEHITTRACLRLGMMRHFRPKSFHSVKSLEFIPQGEPASWDRSYSPPVSVRWLKHLFY